MTTKSDHRTAPPYIPRPTPDRSAEATEWLENLAKKAESPEFWEQPPISIRMAESFKKAGLTK
jgi:hypothetical protein